MPKPRRQLRTTVPHPERLWWLAAVAVAFVISNATIVPMLGQVQASETWIGLAEGGVLAQILILAFFAVFGPGANLPRQVTIWLLSGALMGSFALGVKFARSSPSILANPSDELLFSMYAMPLMICVSQVPLWGLRYFLGWRVLTSDEKRTNHERMSIGGMLTATAVVAAAFGLSRLGLIKWTNEMEWWRNIGIVSVVSLFISVLVLPIVSLLILRSQSGKRGCIAAGLYLAGCILTLLLVANSSERMRLRGETYQYLWMIYVSITGYLLTSLAIFRWAGYRLWWGRPAPSDVKGTP
ncbi:MAG: hypothetical protein ACKVP0_02505 [Pirellulaceae bacterium]